MNPADFMRLIDELWPRCELPDKVLAELARRVCSWPPMNYKMAEAALTEYAINSPKYEKRTPDAGSLQRVLRNAAYPPSSAKPSNGSSEYQDREPPPGGFVTGSQYREWARANGVPVYLDGAIGKGTSK